MLRVRGVVFDLVGTLLEPAEASYRPYPDVAPALAQLAELGLRLAILTDGRVEPQRAAVRAALDPARFDVILDAEDVGAATPDPAVLHAGFQAVCRALDLAPHEVVHVGNDVDVLGARAAGLVALHLDRSGTRSEPDPDRIVSLDTLAYRIALATRRHEAEAQRAALLVAIEETRTARSLSVADDEHDPDGSLASLDQARDVALLEAIEHTLSQLDAAQQRLAGGADLRCEECRGEIGTGRLLARPETRHCVRCASATSARSRGRRR